MLKGHVFKDQRFGVQIFALFINTFLNGKNGINNNYKNSMEVTYSGSNITIDSGAACVQGRFLEEETSTTLSAGTDSLYCKLVIEIDLSKINTTSVLNQAYYKIISNSSAFPELTQDDIIGNNTGVYQYELARFKTGNNGITEFKDMRTYLDFESIYEEIREHIQDIDDESIFVLKSDLKELISYSTEEKVVGEYRNGEKIYEKTIVVGALPNDNTSRINHGISNFKRLIKIEASWYDTDDRRWYSDKRPPSSAIGIYIDFRLSDTQLIIEGRGANWSSRTRDCDVTIRYTKTTD